jgi:hypothetical protein
MERITKKGKGKKGGKEIGKEGERKRKKRKKGRGERGTALSNRARQQNANTSYAPAFKRLTALVE